VRIKLMSVFVDDQDKALRFYSEVLGFVKKTELPAGAFKWLTVVSPDGPDDLELLLEPNATPAAKAYQEAIHRAGIPCATFLVDDIQAEYERLRANQASQVIGPASGRLQHGFTIEQVLSHHLAPTTVVCIVAGTDGRSDQRMRGHTTEPAEVAPWSDRSGTG
jgi:catechol 2,3-dioxygenase-like lactoylglutathione lyase family enzyme